MADAGARAVGAAASLSSRRSGWVGGGRWCKAQQLPKDCSARRCSTQLGSNAVAQRIPHKHTHERSTNTVSLCFRPIPAEQLPTQRRLRTWRRAAWQHLCRRQRARLCRDPHGLVHPCTLLAREELVQNGRDVGGAVHAANLGDRLGVEERPNSLRWRGQKEQQGGTTRGRAMRWAGCSRDPRRQSRRGGGREGGGPHKCVRAPLQSVRPAAVDQAALPKAHAEQGAEHRGRLQQHHGAEPLRVVG